MDEIERTASLTVKVERRAATPIAGAVAGMLFAVLFSVCLTIIDSTTTGLASETGAWLETGATQFRLALALVPFAGLFFLWFIAVTRERLGRNEDQFFATVFLGSGLLFLATIFGAAASAGAMAATYAHDPAGFAASNTYFYSRQMVSQIFYIYGLRMAAVFMISLATLWWRTRVMPRWMALVTYPLALILLFIVTQVWWVVLVFPAWVFLVSVYILVTHLTGGAPVPSVDAALPRKDA
jgi:hypothetical protein